MSGHSLDLMAGERGEVDRASPDAARGVVELILPDPGVRLALLRKLAESIRCAAETGSAGWGLTLFSNGFRLNAGMVEVVVVNDRWAFVLVAEAPRVPLPASCLSVPGGYRTIPGSARIETSVQSDLVDAWNLLGSEHLGAIRIGARRTGYAWKDTHSPGLLAYIEQETGSTVPDPSWAPRSSEQRAVRAFPIGAIEGARRLESHYARERDRAIVALAKQQWESADPFLRCRVCGFSFVETFGICYVEAHHREPLGRMSEDETTTTTVADLVPVCANCHATLHDPNFADHSVEALSRHIHANFVDR